MLEVQVVKRLGPFALDARFQAGPGVTAIFGRSGAGKTSVVQAVAGLMRPDAGRIVAQGRVLFDSAAGVNLRPERRQVGYVFQDGRLFPHMSVLQNLRYGGRVDEDGVIALLGLDGLLTRRPGALSGGERQRVAIGRALMAGPQILLMDEPLSALDAGRRAEILPWLERLRDSAGLPVLYVSHAIAEVARLAATLVVMDAGRVVRAGPVADVLSDPAALPLIGVAHGGAVLIGRIGAHDAGDGLTDVVLAGGRIVLPGPLGATGAPIRVRVAAQDITLSLTRPHGISALNILPVTVLAVVAGQGPGVAVQLAFGPDRLLARITRRSAAALALQPGMAIWALAKATAVAQGDVGG